MRLPLALFLTALALSLPIASFARSSPNSEVQEAGKGKLTSNELVAMCDSNEPGAVKNCQSYIRGVAEAFALSNAPEVGVCLPQTLPLSVVTLAASIELSNDAEPKNNSAAVAKLKKLLAANYPCH